MPDLPRAVPVRERRRACARDENFHYQYNLDDPKAIEAIQFCYDLYWTDQVCYMGSSDWGSWEGLWRMGKTALYEVASWNMADYFEDLEDDEIGILLIPKGPSAYDYVNAQSMPRACVCSLWRRIRRPWPPS